VEDYVVALVMKQLGHSREQAEAFIAELSPEVVAELETSGREANVRVMRRLLGLPVPDAPPESLELAEGDEIGGFRVVGFRKVQQGDRAPYPTVVMVPVETAAAETPSAEAQGD